MKHIITFDDLPPDVEEYLALDAEIKRLSKRLDELKTLYRASVRLYPEFTETDRYTWGPLSFACREKKELDQLKTFKLFNAPKNRQILFPTYVEFKLKKEHDLLPVTYGYTDLAINVGGQP